jgi:quercetin dioxygenase-like cupin family protein
MRLDALPGLALAFVLGACATAAVQHAVPAAQAALAPTVVAFADAPAAENPPKTARVHHLARGANAYVGLLEMAPGAAVPTHRDATEEYIYVLEGEGRMSIDGQTYAVTAGTTIFMPADAEVSFQNGDRPLRGLQVFAGPGPAAKYDAWTPVER